MFKINKIGWLLIFGVPLVFLILTIGFYYILIKYTPVNTEILNRVLAVITPGLMAIGAALFKPIRNRLSDFAFEKLLKPQNELRILLYGSPGTGKTTLRKAFFEVGTIGKQEPTKNWVTSHIDRSIDIDEPKKGKVRIMLADYQGQKPQQVICHRNPAFFGSELCPLVNAVFFIVDIIPTLYNDKSSNSEDENRKNNSNLDEFDDIEYIEWLKENGTKKIENRVSENFRYLNEWSIDAILENVFNKKDKSANSLYSIRLIINKMDILQGAIQKGYLGENINLEQYTKDLYKKLDDHIKLRCDNMKLTDYQISIISAKDRNNVCIMFESIYEIYKSIQLPKL